MGTLTHTNSQTAIRIDLCAWILRHSKQIQYIKFKMFVLYCWYHTYHITPVRLCDMQHVMEYALLFIVIIMETLLKSFNHITLTQDSRNYLPRKVIKLRVPLPGSLIYRKVPLSNHNFRFSNSRLINPHMRNQFWMKQDSKWKIYRKMLMLSSVL